MAKIQAQTQVRLRRIPALTERKYKDDKKPLFRAVAEIRRVLGLQNAFVHVNEVAVRLLRENATASGASLQTFLKEAGARTIGVRVGASEWAPFEANVARMYIVQIHAIFDRLLDELRWECLPIKQWQEKAGGETLDSLDRFIRLFDASTQNEVKELPEYRLLTYYRQVRNAVVHQDREKADAAYVAISNEDRRALKEAYKSEAPNSFDTLTYDDFAMYTRAAKRYAFVLNDVAELTAKDLARSLLSDGKRRASLHSAWQRDEKQRVAPGHPAFVRSVLRNYYKQHHGAVLLTFVEELYSAVVDGLECA